MASFFSQLAIRHHHRESPRQRIMSNMLLFIAASLVHLVCLIGRPSNSLIVTSVIAGDKKFKTVSFDSKFLPALKFEKTLPLPTEFRTHRTLRPPKFDIDVNIPIKLPMEDEYPQEDDYHNKKPIESNFFFQTGEINEGKKAKLYKVSAPAPSYHDSPPVQSLYAAATNQDHHRAQEPMMTGDRPQQKYPETGAPNSIQDILQRPEDKASNKFSDGIDGVADSSKLDSVGIRQNPHLHQQQQQQQQQQHQHQQQQQQQLPNNNNNQHTPRVNDDRFSSGTSDYPKLQLQSMRSSPHRRQQQQVMPSLLPLLNNLRSVHRARSLFQLQDKIDSRSSLDTGYDHAGGSNMAYADSSSTGAGGNSGAMMSQDGQDTSAYLNNGDSSSSSLPSNSPSPTATYQHMGTQYYTQPGYMHHFQAGSGIGQDSNQDSALQTGGLDQQTAGSFYNSANQNQDYLASQMAVQNQQADQFQQQQASQSKYSPQQHAALINSYIMHQQQQSGIRQQQRQQQQQQQQQQNIYLYPSGQSSAMSNYGLSQQSQQPQSLPSELQPTVTSGGITDSGQASSAGQTSQSNDLQSAQTQQQQYDTQIAQQMQEAESQNDYGQNKQNYANGNQYGQQQQYYQQEFVPGGFINLHLKGPEGGPKMTYADYDRERWAQQVSQATGAMPNHVLNYQQLQNFYGGLGTFTNGLSDRYVSNPGILEKLKSSLHTLTSKFHLG